MKILRKRRFFLAGGVAGTWLMVCALSAGAAPPAKVLLEGFENPKALKPIGRVAVVSGADAVTEGKSALELPPQSGVAIRVAARALDLPGWLKIDTFQPQPVLTCLSVDLGGGRPFLGYVLPQDDTLALPLSVVALADRGPWPAKDIELKLTNTGPQLVVVDNVRLVAPATAPDGAVLLDFGPTNQVLWPGFEPAEVEARGLTWGGEGKIRSYGRHYPDALLGDFAGAYPGYKVQESVSVQTTGGQRHGWIWVTHFGTGFGPALEYRVKLNHVVRKRRLSPAQMLSGKGLLIGMDGPWTTKWLEEEFVPWTVTRLDGPLRGGNKLELSNCQLAAMVTVPERQQARGAEYVRRLEADLKRYRRQFVLGTEQRPRCEVVPTDDESKAGVMLFLPPRDEWFCRDFVPSAKHRAAALKVSLAAGSSTLAGLVVVPCRDGGSLRADLDCPRDPAGGALPGAGCRVQALDAVPVLRDGAVRYQPFLPARALSPIRRRGVCWFVLELTAAEQTRPGTYRGAVRVTLDRTAARLPLEVEVVDVGPPPAANRTTFGIINVVDCGSAYGALAPALPAQGRVRLTRKIFARLSAGGFNASLLEGPSAQSSSYKPVTAGMTGPLADRLRMEGNGKSLVSLRRALAAVGGLQRGTGRYRQVLRALVSEIDKQARKYGLKEYALYCGEVGGALSLAEAARLVEIVRGVGGRPALLVSGGTLTKCSPEAQASVLKPLDTLVVTPGAGLLAVADAFKARFPTKTLALRAYWPDTYTFGFYCWGVGADGAYQYSVFASVLPFNAFEFDGRSLLVPTARGDFEPSLSMLRIGQGIADYRLARRCEALADRARRKGVDAGALRKVLAEIRLTADRSRPQFDRSRLRSGNVPPETLQRWRDGLVREAGQLWRRLRPQGPHAPRPGK